MGREVRTTGRSSDPLGASLDSRLLREFHPELFGFWPRLRAAFSREIEDVDYIRKMLERGDSRAAIVMSVEPCLVASYTDELDCVVMLRFADWVVEEFSLSVGRRLVSVNFYDGSGDFPPDLIIGDSGGGRHTSVHPIVVDFVCSDRELIELRIASIDEDEWDLTTRLGREYLRRKPGIARDGRPRFCSVAAIRHFFYRSSEVD